MKRRILLCLAALAVAAGLSAQETERQERGPRGPQGPHGREMHRTPEQAATARTDRMNSELKLTEKQYKKIYKIYLKEENARKEAMSAGPMGMPPMGGPGGPMGGPGGFMGGGRPPQGGMQGGMHSGPQGGFGGGMPEGGRMMQGEGQGMPEGFPGMEKPVAKVGGKDIESDEYMDAREEKFRKILTSEQYSRWRTEHPDPAGVFEK